MTHGPLGRLSVMGRVTTMLDRVGSVTKRPPIWAVVSAGLVAFGNGRGRAAALRGGVGYGIAAVLANLVVKPVVHRRRPPDAADHARIGPITSSFPSGHAATDLAFVFGVAQEIPVLFAPLSAATFTAHWSLVRSRAHYVSDILVGGALGIGVALGMRVLWPTGADHGGDPGDSPSVDAARPDRLMTVVQGEQARLAVHVAPLEDHAGTPLQGGGNGAEGAPAAGDRP